MLMDLFYENCNIAKKSRVHFHQFMLGIHKDVHTFNQGLLKSYGRDRHINTSRERDAIAHVAHALSKKNVLICLDEFQVTDICDAMILHKVFDILWSNGTVLVATSNRHPDKLYENIHKNAISIIMVNDINIWSIINAEEPKEDYEVNVQFEIE